MIRVAITDDHALVREGLRRMLSASPDIEVVGEASDGSEAIDLVDRVRPDVLLLDISMPVRDGIETTAELVASGAATRILILTMHAERQYAERTFRAGADGFIGKSVRFEELVHAIAEVARGDRYIPPELEHWSSSSDGRPAHVLSRREFEVMCYLANGMTNREIAERLAISVKTVDTHRGHVLKKLHLRNNSDITRFAIRNGFIHC